MSIRVSCGRLVEFLLRCLQVQESPWSIRIIPHFHFRTIRNAIAISIGLERIGVVDLHFIVVTQTVVVRVCNIWVRPQLCFFRVTQTIRIGILRSRLQYRRVHYRTIDWRAGIRCWGLRRLLGICIRWYRSPSQVHDCTDANDEQDYASDKPDPANRQRTSWYWSGIGRWERYRLGRLNRGFRKFWIDVLEYIVRLVGHGK